MVRKILVPLDTSAFAEDALTLAQPLARRVEAELHLLVVHPTTEDGEELDRDGSRRTTLERGYLGSIERQLAPVMGGRLHAVLTHGQVATAIRAYIQAHRVDLVVMSTHGRGGLRRAWLGSVADALVRSAGVPLLLHRPQPEPTARHRSVCGRIVVALDGSSAAERILSTVLSFAVPGQAAYRLVRAVPPHVQVGPAYYAPTAANLRGGDVEARVEEASDYLRGVARRLAAAGVDVSTTVRMHARPDRAVVDCAREFGADLIAMTTHGRGGIERLVLGSVADAVIRHSDMPVLVFRPADGAPGEPEAAAAVGVGPTP